MLDSSVSYEPQFTITPACCRRWKESRRCGSASRALPSRCRGFPRCRRTRAAQCARLDRHRGQSAHAGAGPRVGGRPRADGAPTTLPARGAQLLRRPALRRKTRGQENDPPRRRVRLHRILAKGVMDQGEAGRYRTIAVRVGRYVPPAPADVSGLMFELLEWWNKRPPSSRPCSARPSCITASKPSIPSPTATAAPAAHWRCGNFTGAVSTPTTSSRSTNTTGKIARATTLRWTPCASGRRPHGLAGVLR